MAEAQIYINDSYNVSSSTNTVVQYVDQTIEAAKTDIIQDIRPEIDNLVDESLSSKMSNYSLTSHTHDSYATKEDLNSYSLTSHTHSQYALATETYSKQETDLKIETSIPDLTPYATKDELSQYSTISHTHDLYALAESVYTKSETENLVSSFVPDLSSYYTKSETNDLISGFKNISYLTTQQYEELESKDPSTLYVLIDSTEEEIDLSQYVTKEELEQKNYKSILYITTQQYQELESKDPSTLYVLTDSTEDPVDLTNYYSKSETDNLISGFKNIEYLTTEAYNSLENKDENVLYVLTDSTEEEIDLSQYVTNDELNAKGFKKIEYITTEAYEALDPKSPDVLYILTDSQEETIDLSQFSLTSHTHNDYALNSSLSEHMNNASAHFTAEEKEAYDAFAGEFYQDDAWNIMPMTAFNDFTGDWSQAMGQFDTRIANNDSSISAIKTRLNEFSLTSHTHADYVLNASLSDNYYNKTYIDTSISALNTEISNVTPYYFDLGQMMQTGITDEHWNDLCDAYDKHVPVFVNYSGQLITITYLTPLAADQITVTTTDNAVIMRCDGTSDVGTERFMFIKNGSNDYSVQNTYHHWSDYYTQSHIDTSLNNVYTKSEIDTMIGSIETSLASI